MRYLHPVKKKSNTTSHRVEIEGKVDRIQGRQNAPEFYKMKMKTKKERHPSSHVPHRSSPSMEAHSMNYSKKVHLVLAQFQARFHPALQNTIPHDKPPKLYPSRIQCGKFIIEDASERTNLSEVIFGVELLQTIRVHILLFSIANALEPILLGYL